MKKFLLLTVAALAAATSYADYRAIVFKGDKPISQTKVSNIVSLTAKDKVLTQNSSDSQKNFAFTDMDSMAIVPDTVYIHYDGAAAVVKNPLANLGVYVNVVGADVKVVTDTTVFDMKDVVFALSGTSTNGSFSMEQLKRTTVLLNNLNLTSANGAVISMVGDKGVTLDVVGENFLLDAPSRAATDSLGAALYINDKLEVVGAGSLSVSGTYKQGIFVKDDMVVSGASLASVATKAAIRVKDNFVLNGGAVSAESSDGSCIDVNDTVFVNAGLLTAAVKSDDAKAITCDGGYYQVGGDVVVLVNGNGSKGIKVGSLEVATNSFKPSDILISGGSVTVTLGAVASYTDASGESSSPAGLKADGNISINGTANVIVTAPEGSEAVKGIASDGNVYIGGQSVVKLDILSGSGKSWCIKTEGTLYVNPNCVKATCNTDNPKYDSDKAGLYKFNSLDNSYK